jgi:hypothetical protein
MVIRWHKSDYRKLANEDEVRAAIRKSAPAPGQYVIPYCKDSKEMAGEAMKRKFTEGPNAVVYVRPSGEIQLGPFLVKWFLYTLFVGFIAGYVARAVLPPGAPYLRVFQVVGAAAWLGYAWQSPQESIWKGKPWSLTFREMFDGLIYAALTAGVYGWRWPH